MAKKTTKQIRRPKRASTSPASTIASSRGFDRDFNPDYAPVVKDLKRIGILAGTFILVMVILSFVL